MKVLLVATEAENGFMPLGIFSLIANIKKNKALWGKVDIDYLKDIKANTSHQEILNKILESSPDIVGFSCFCWNYETFMRLIKELKKAKKEVITIVGGPEIGGDVLEILKKNKGIAYAISGEGEKRFHDLLFSIVNNKKSKDIEGVYYRKGNNIFYSAGYKEDTLEDVVSPYTMNVMPNNFENGEIMVETSRGCVYSCSYCLWNTSKFRLFPIKKIEDEISFALKKGITKISFLDSAINISEVHLRNVCESINNLDSKKKLSFIICLDLMRINQKQINILKKINVKTINFGLQTISKEALKNINRAYDTKIMLKNYFLLRNNFPNTTINADLILGLPGDNFNSFKKAFLLLKKIRVDNIEINPLIVNPGTHLEKSSKKFGLVYSHTKPQYVRSNYSFSEPELKYAIKYFGRIQKRSDMI